MKSQCEFHHKQIARSLFEQMPEEERQILESHLEECALCRAERDAFQQTLRDLKEIPDLKPPRHFFVYPETQRPNAWDLFQQLSWWWKGALVTAGVAMVFLGGVMALNLHFELQENAFLVSFGGPPRPEIDPQQLRTQLLEEVSRRIEERDRVLMQAFLQDLETTKESLSRRHQRELASVGGRLEQQMDEKIELQFGEFQLQNSQSLVRLYDAVMAQHRLDLLELNERVNHLVLNDQIEHNQNDAILSTLFDLVDLRLQ